MQRCSRLQIGCIIESWQQIMKWLYLSFFKGVFSPYRSTYHIGSLITAETFTWQYAPESEQISNAPAEELGCS